MTLTGTLVEIFDTKQITEKFSKRDFVIETTDANNYKEVIKLEFHNEKTSLLENYGIGKTVNVEFNIKGRSANDKQGNKVYYNTLQAWKIS